MVKTLVGMTLALFAAIGLALAWDDGTVNRQVHIDLGSVEP